MRRAEMTEGIAVKDRDGKEHGKSKIAGGKVLGQVTLTRVFLPLPVLALPPAIMAFFDRYPAIKTNKRIRIPLEIAVVTTSLWLALPSAIGLFPQEMEMNARDLEPQFRSLKDKHGRPIETFLFNKGL